MTLEALQLEAAAIQLFIAQFEDAFEASLGALPDLRCQIAKRGRADLQALLKTEARASKDSAVFWCATHEVHHLYSIQEYRQLLQGAISKIVKPYRRTLQRYGLTAAFKTDTTAIVADQLRSTTVQDHRLYSDERVRFEVERKIESRKRAASRVPLSLQQLDEFTSCYRKQAHPTPYHAQRHLGRLLAANNMGGELHIYQCSYCTGWHVGHKSNGGGGSTPLEDRILRAWALFRRRPEHAIAFCEEKRLNYVGLLQH
jgi:hypothetical protein